MLKRIRVRLYPPEQPHWHGDCLVSSLSTFKRFHTFSYKFIVQFGQMLPAAFASRSIDKVKITKHASTSTNYAILTKKVEVIKGMVNLFSHDS